MKYIFNITVFVCLLFAIAAPVAAQEADPDMPNYSYERPTFEKLAQLYWALGKFTSKSDVAVDNFLMINECDVYRDYYNNEFDWKGIRDAAREFLDQNKATFPLRFEIMQPLRLGDYDLEKQGFYIQDEFRMDNVRRFEILADNYDRNICGYDGGTPRNIDGYPRGLEIEMSRPINMVFLPVPADISKQYIDQRMEKFKEMKSDFQNTKSMYELRDAYLVMKVKFFSYQRDVKIKDSLVLAQVLAILEGIEVYGDRNKSQLLFSEDYRHKKRSKSKTSKDALKNNYEPEKGDNYGLSPNEPVAVDPNKKIKSSSVN